MNYLSPQSCSELASFFITVVDTLPSQLVDANKKRQIKSGHTALAAAIFSNNKEWMTFLGRFMAWMEATGIKPEYPPMEASE